jgi:cysteinyl-tRNA synthetase
LLDNARNSLDGFYTALRSAKTIEVSAAPVADSPVFAALLDDLNTPQAIAELHALAKQLNKASDAQKSAAKAALLAGGEALGLLQEDPESWFTAGGDEGLGADAINALIVERAEAKASKDFARADAIRDELSAAGVVLEDGPSGTTWRRE